MCCPLPSEPSGFWIMLAQRMWGHAAQPSLSSTYNRPRASVHAVLSLTFPRYIESGCTSARLGCQQPSTASENPREEGKKEKEGEEKGRGDREGGGRGGRKEEEEEEEKEVPFLWSRNYASHINNVILSSSHV